MAGKSYPVGDLCIAAFHSGVAVQREVLSLRQGTTIRAYLVVSRDEWLIQRRALLAREREVIHLRDTINTERQVLPWVKVDAAYVFESPEGRKTLFDLFDDRSQLMTCHFMPGPGQDAGYSGYSFLSDHISRMLPHLNHHDVTFVVVPRAPMDKAATYKRRMGWQFAWVPPFSSTFSYDYYVSFSQNKPTSESADYNYAATPREEAHDELPGTNAPYKDEIRNVFCTCSAYTCDSEDMVGILLLLNYAPLDHNENDPMSWVRRYDEYEDTPNTHGCSAM